MKSANGLNAAPSRAAALIFACLGLATIASAQCSDATTTMWGHSYVTRLSGNIEKLYNDTVMTGNYYNWWYAYIASGWSLNYVQQGNVTQWHTNNSYAINETYEPTLQVYGPGHYTTASSHTAYTPYCDYHWWPSWFTTGADGDVVRPVISRGEAPFFLGSGVLQSGTYTAQSILSSNGNGAPETPTYIITGGASYGSLSCTTCSTTVYTATAPMSCGNYAFTAVASYGGFTSGPLWMFNNSPASMVIMGTNAYGLPNASGWEIDYTYKVVDVCGNPMSWVEVNESFTSSQRVYPNPTNWPLPGEGTWTLASWSNNSPNPDLRFSAWGDFVDHIWEQYGNPSAMPWGWNGLLEDPANTVLKTNQWFKAGTVVNGSGIVIRSDWIWKYIDHGVAL